MRVCLRGSGKTMEAAGALDVKVHRRDSGLEQGRRKALNMKVCLGGGRKAPEGPSS
jgi:hypothetical protein